MISFVMPAYKARFLAQAIESILSQTDSDWELVVVDDESPEDLGSILASYHDSRICYYRNEHNLGGENLVRQWNYAITLAKGDWIALAADDDLYAPGFCEECVRLIAKYPDADLVRARVLQIDECGKALWDDGVLSEFTNKYEFLYDWLTSKAFTCIGNYLFRKEALMRIGGFMDFPCAFGSDIATPIALSKNGVANTADMLFSFRQSGQHLSADTSRFNEKLAGITQLSEWFRNLRYEEPDNETDKQFYSILNEKYLHDKCVYDYFNLVIKNVPFSDLSDYLKLCKLASNKDKLMMFLRWIKNRIQH